MKTIDISLTDNQFSILNEQYPITAKTSSSIGKRAEEIVKYYFGSVHPSCQFTKPKGGADLLVEWDAESIKIEIKGTDDNSVSFGKLKVSSLASHDLLKDGLPLYRVISIFNKNPKILILKYGVDFVMKPEPRWSVHAVNA